MTTRVVCVDSKAPEQDKIQEVVDILRSGGIAGVPTETVFGLACNGYDKNAVERLYEIKNRPANKSFVIQIAGVKNLADYKARVTPMIENMLTRFWPGPLTIIVETKNGKMGFRMPDNNATLSIIRESDFPLIVTSANISGEKGLLCAEDVRAVFDEKIQIVVNDNTCAKGAASTVIDCTREPFQILRKGLIAEEVYRFCQIPSGMK